MAVRGLLTELKGWARFLLPSKYRATYYPSPPHIVDTMLSLAQVSAADTVYDLGCGDGRIVVTAAQRYGAKGLGVELCPDLAAAARAKVAAAGVGELVHIQQGDAADVDVSAASVIALYLSESGNRELLAATRGTLTPGTRIVSHHFPIQGWEQRLARVDRSCNIHIYLYNVPA